GCSLRGGAPAGGDRLPDGELGTASDAFDDGGHAHAAADAQRDEGEAAAGAVQLVDGGAGDHGAGGAERVAHGDGAAVDVELLVGDAELLLGVQDDGREGLVDLPD